MEIVVATRNLHKLEEIRQILAGLPVTLRSAEELGAPDVVEDRPTLRGNAQKKASAVARHTGRLALADDTGLEVDAIDGRPGVYSARYAGEKATYADNCARLLRELDGVPPARRTARFRCVIALVAPTSAGPQGDGDGASFFAEGTLEGEIATAPRGDFGFGYDPLFVVAEDPRRRTLAEMPPGEKNALSHRGRALAALRARLPELLDSSQLVKGKS